MSGDKKLRTMQGVAAIVVGVVTLLSVFAGDRFPWLQGVAVFVSWIAGKMLGSPIETVTSSALQSMKPAKQIELTIQAVQSLPPAKQDEVTRGVLEEIAARAAPNEEARALAHTLLASLPPTAQSPALEQIVFVGTDRPPPFAAEHTPEVDEPTPVRTMPKPPPLK